MLDRRTDIWSFGCVLFEMLAGHSTFLGETLSDTLVGILDRDPDWQALPSATPMFVKSLLRRCLNKNPKHRLRDIGDARVEIQDSTDAPSSESLAELPSTLPSASWGRALPLTLAVAASAALVAGLTMWAVTRPESPRIVRFRISNEPASQLFVRTGFAPDIAVSPDGDQIAYVAGTQTSRMLKNSAKWDRQS